ncbi:hypothetical protein DM860_012918 [Cuscuta australis]|uniref:Uncharacterized protein n=1 Tax=Cuscuta australis TaxID=267555 RepID=A0A328DUR9_9ASTE|nr:hypothetical protein DM860_012918 [Cuscuta australis]
MDFEDLRYVFVIGETVDDFDHEKAVEDEKTFSVYGQLVIEQLHPLVEGIPKVEEVVPDSGEEDEHAEPLKAPMSSFVVCVAIDGSIPEIDMAVKTALEKEKRKALPHGRKRKKFGDIFSHMAGINKVKKLAMKEKKKLAVENERKKVAVKDLNNLKIEISKWKVLISFRFGWELFT